jgi:hypothetical protein
MALRHALMAGALALTASLSAQAAPAAELFLGSFQNGNFTNDTGAWQLTGIHGDGSNDAAVIANGATGLLHSETGTIYHSYDVDPFFAYLVATGDPEPTTVYQGFNLPSRALFSGAAAFLARDEAPYNDLGWVRIYAGADDGVIFPLAADCVLADGCVSQLFYHDIASAGPVGVGDYGETPWTPFSVELGQGDYFIVAYSGNGPDGDTLNPSYLLVDGFRAVAVPEPAAWATLILGFFGLGGLLRRRRAVLA